MLLSCDADQQENIRARIREFVEENPAQPTYKQDMINYLNAIWKKYPLKYNVTTETENWKNLSIKTLITTHVSFDKTKKPSKGPNSKTEIDNQLKSLENKLEPELSEAYNYYSDTVIYLWDGVKGYNGIDEFNAVRTVNANTVLDPNGIPEWKLTAAETRELQRINAIMDGALEVLYQKRHPDEYNNNSGKTRSFRWAGLGHEKLIENAIKVNSLQISDTIKANMSTASTEPDRWGDTIGLGPRCRKMNPNIKQNDLCLWPYSNPDMENWAHYYYYNETTNVSQGNAPEITKKYADTAKNLPISNILKYYFLAIASHFIGDVGNSMHTDGAPEQVADLVGQHGHYETTTHFLYEDWVEKNMDRFTPQITAQTGYQTGITPEQMVKDNAKSSRPYFKDIHKGISECKDREHWFNDPVLKAKITNITQDRFFETAYYVNSLVHYVMSKS